MDLEHDPDRPRADGFTLVEIVIAIVLVGVLSAVVVVGVSRITGKGESAACTASRDAAESASVSYFALHGQYPDTIPQMVSGDQLTLADGVTVTDPLVASGSGWSLTMVPLGPATKPVFNCTER